jgi:uncharacterized membrane protein YraQ (UPF0718 family)
LQTVFRWGINSVAVACLAILYLIFTNRDLPNLSISSIVLQNFKTIFLSIILEAFPFILLGVIVAALLNVFVSEDMVRRFVPKNPVLGVLFGCFLGVIFPLCECGMIPVVRRLILKGMPLYVGVIYILTGPILNPVVFASTFMAFRSRPEIAYSRMFLAFAAAVIIGSIIYKFVKSNPLKNHAGALHPQHSHSHSKKNKMFSTVGHASDEFFEMGKYLMFGAMVTAVIQTFVSRESLVSIGQGEVSSHIFMMVFAYVLSICSTSDAFVASSFLSTFSIGSLLTFLVFGPMLDFKTTLMMLAVFRIRFVLLLVSLIIVVVLACSLIFQQIYPYFFQGVI